jgi:hypothetical protein
MQLIFGLDLMEAIVMRINLDRPTKTVVGAISGFMVKVGN